MRPTTGTWRLSFAAIAADEERPLRLIAPKQKLQSSSFDRFNRLAWLLICKPRTHLRFLHHFSGSFSLALPLDKQQQQQPAKDDYHNLSLFLFPLASWRKLQTARASFFLPPSSCLSLCLSDCMTQLEGGRLAATNGHSVPVCGLMLHPNKWKLTYRERERESSFSSDILF